MTLRKAASLDDLWSGEMMSREVDGNSILLVNVDDHIYAYADACPHQKSRLSEGSLSGRTLRCGRHHWEFDACTGRGINPESACLKILPVTIANGDIFISLDEEICTETAANLERQP